MPLVANGCICKVWTPDKSRIPEESSQTRRHPTATRRLETHVGSRNIRSCRRVLARITISLRIRRPWSECFEAAGREDAHLPPPSPSTLSSISGSQGARVQVCKLEGSLRWASLGMPGKRILAGNFASPPTSVESLCQALAKTFRLVKSRWFCPDLSNLLLEVGWAVVVVVAAADGKSIE